MKDNYMETIIGMLNNYNKQSLAEKLKNSYYEYHFLSEWNDYITAKVYIFVEPNSFIGLDDIQEDEKQSLITIFNALPSDYDEIADIEFKINPLVTIKHTQLTTFWEQGYFKLFISHLAKYKKQASNLQKELKNYGIDCFVAHEDIKPSKQWQDEIENALGTMDALTAILRDGFKESNWCDQEIGFAVGTNKLIIPIRQGIDPYGFIGKYQAIQGKNTTVQEVSKSIFETISTHIKTKNHITLTLINLISNSTHIETSLKLLDKLVRIEDIPKEFLVQMTEQIKNNTILIDNKKFLQKLKILFDIYKISLPIKDIEKDIDLMDDIPF